MQDFYHVCRHVFLPQTPIRKFRSSAMYMASRRRLSASQQFDSGCVQNRDGRVGASERVS